jgi:hypothetical protein
MQLEAQEKLGQASEYYDFVLKDDPTNIVHLPPSLFVNVTLILIRWSGNAE